MAKIEDWLTEARLRKLAGWRREGRSEEEIAEKIGISARALARWKKRDERFRRALEVDPEAVDFQVEDALLRKALGYESVEKRVEVSAKGERKEVETTKQVGPDMSAISLWPKKRKGGQWGDGAAGPKPENNLLQLLDEEGGADVSAIPELQFPATAGADLVEAE